MLALVMAGGRGSRMRPMSDVIPKPLLPVRDRPVLEWTLRVLEAAGITETIVSTGYLAELIGAYLTARPRSRMAVRYLVEDTPLGTAGAIGLLRPLTGPLLVINGDVLTTAHLSELIEVHQSTGALITLGTRTVVHETRGGVVRGRPSGIFAYQEKPRISYEIAAGVTVLSRPVEELIPPGRLDMPELVNAALARGLSVRSHALDGYWMDIGVPEQYEAAVRDFPGLEALEGE